MIEFFIAIMGISAAIFIISTIRIILIVIHKLKTGKWEDLY